MSPKTGAASISREAVVKLESALEELSLAIARRVERVCELDGAGMGDDVVGEAAALRTDIDRMTRWGEKLRKLVGAANAGKPVEEDQGGVDVPALERIMEEGWANVIVKHYGLPERTPEE